jgi:hypothetical protein
MSFGMVSVGDSKREKDLAPFPVRAAKKIVEVECPHL